ncbi:hypothetical protein E2C01_000565 [Portunus trituberculatus]|uniref:Uncharacterized protein n=1 Tax=Portunus trituberculatus TaxID=210409 RepID=A0A5B7CHT0_PORTR|nr:hypothetical protein [Portunus trituberculatus]
MKGLVNSYMREFDRIGKFGGVFQNIVTNKTNASSYPLQYWDTFLPSDLCTI